MFCGHASRVAFAGGKPRKAVLRYRRDATTKAANLSKFKPNRYKPESYVLLVAAVGPRPGRAAAFRAAVAADKDKAAKGMLLFVIVASMGVQSVMHGKHHK